MARVAIVCSRYNEWATSPLLEGAVAEYRRRVGDERGLTVVHVPGSFEIPVVAGELAGSGRYDAIVCLGCLIRGETSHDRYIAEAVSRALMRIACQWGLAVGFGILTVDSADQARARAGGERGNKGVEAMAAALETAGVLAAVRRTPASRRGGTR